MDSLICALPLNLNFVEILIHLVNLAILFVAIRFLLYKPIKKFIANRAQEYEKQDEECQKKELKALEMKEEYEQLLTETKQNTLQITENATRSAESRADEIIAEAQKKATEILRKADDDVRRKMEDEAKRLKLSISDLAYSMAAEILKREVNEKDLDEELNNIIGKWDNA